MDDETRAYVEGIPAGTRPLFDRLHGLVTELHPEADLALSYGMPTYRVHGLLLLHVGSWRHGVSLYGWDAERGAEFAARHPGTLTSKGTIRLRPDQAAAIPDEHLRALIGDDPAVSRSARPR